VPPVQSQVHLISPRYRMQHHALACAEQKIDLTAWQNIVSLRAGKSCRKTCVAPKRENKQKKPRAYGLWPFALEIIARRARDALGTVLVSAQKRTRYSRRCAAYVQISS
jgi:hypothetical protein